MRKSATRLGEGLVGSTFLGRHQRWNTLHLASYTLVVEMRLADAISVDALAENFFLRKDRLITAKREGGVPSGFGVCRSDLD